MALSSNSGSDVFDIRRVRRLVELMQENDLTELDIQQGEMRIQLKRAAPVVQAIPTASIPAVTQPMPLPATHLETVAQTLPPEPLNVHIIKSPMVGTFYAASNPESPSFVKVGDVVVPEKTVCLIEAMKVYNEIQAECSGKIVAILVKNGETVEFGTPLFKVTPE